MNKYDLALVFKPDLDEEGHKAAVERVHGLISRFGGNIEKVDDWGKRRLAYEIEKINEGYYSFVTFDAEPAVPAEIESRVRIMDDLLRYLIVRVDE